MNLFCFLKHFDNCILTVNFLCNSMYFYLTCLKILLCEMVCRLCHTAKRTHGTENFMKSDLGNSRAILYKEHGSMDDLIEYSHPSSSGPLL